MDQYRGYTKWQYVEKDSHEMVDFLFFYPRKQKVYHTVGTFLQDGLWRYFLAFFCFSTYPTQILLLVVVVSVISPWDIVWKDKILYYRNIMG